ncbi:sensor domain-containing diguanylate cyclase [bacterium]|nr:sensor domain-containing diguanylate cyclase [bacterium]
MNVEISEQCMEFHGELLGMLTTHRHYERIFHLVVDRIARLYRCQSCAIILIDPETELLSVENCTGISHTFCKEFRSRVSTTAIGELLWTGRPILIPDASSQMDLASQVQLEQPFASCLAVQLSSHHKTLGYLYADTTRVGAFDEEDVSVFKSFANLAALALYQNRLYERNMHLDAIDHETGLQQYSFFSDNLLKNLVRARNSGEYVGLLMMDIDNFGAIAATFGAEAKRAFLDEFGKTILAHLRSYDAACRYGADEIIVMLPDTRLDATLGIAGELCGHIRSRTFTNHRIQTTVSCGAAAFPGDGDDAESLILSVKRSVFEAQRAGRDRIYHRERSATPDPAELP